MKVYLQLAAILLLFALVPFVPGWLDRLNPETEKAKPRRTKTFRQTLAQGVHMAGASGVEAVRCRTCTLEKRRKGPFTLGGFNVLRLEGLRVVMPLDARPPRSSGRERDKEEGPQEVANYLGIGRSFLQIRGVKEKFSGLLVDSLEVAELDGTNVVTVFTAEHGEAKRDGLHLTGCVVFSPDTNAVGKAVLKVKPRPQLNWKGGSLDLSALHPRRNGLTGGREL